MDAKLKALKVADLKELLTKSGTPIPSKANKADLIAKILETPDALKLVDGGSAAEAPKTADDELLAPPDEFDWDGGADSSKATPATETAPATEAPAETEASANPTSAEPAPETTTTDAPAAESSEKAPEELEIERRKARAARFGVPYVETPASTDKGNKGPRAKGRAAGATAQGGGPKTAGDAGQVNNAGGGNRKKDDAPKSLRISAKEAAPNDDDAKLAARAARFGISGTASTSAAADPAEEEKRKKREARFGGADSSAKKPKTDA